MSSGTAEYTLYGLCQRQNNSCFMLHKALLAKGHHINICPGNVIIDKYGDSKSKLWGSLKEDRNGMLMKEFIATEIRHTT